ncbi:MAG: FAD-dependent oxidoreductase [Ignavibacteriaceae bacterium]
MPKPVIMTIDDELQVRNAVERDLRVKYGKEYRIIKTASGAEALETTKQLKQRNDQVALFLADQRMPVMDGTEFLLEAMKIYPNAAKVLLTAYTDTKAAIDSINNVGLDYYLMKPWDPPEQNLYPVLDDLLSDWMANAELPYDGIRVAGTLWSPGSHTIKDFLSRCQIPYKWLDIENDEEARLLVESVSNENLKLPVVFFPDGTFMVEPDITSIAEKTGFKTKAEHPFYDLIIVGAGPAGLAAAVYGSSEGLHTLLIDKETTGGQAGTSSRIENYLGFPTGISGVDLARRAATQAARLGAEIITAQEVKKIAVKDPYKIVTLANGTEVVCYALIIATGVSLNQLDVPGIEKLTGAGVYYGAALSEAIFYKDEHIYVIGGANSAGQGAMFFSRYAKKVTMLVRSNLSKNMSQYLINQIKNTPNIEVLQNTEIVEVQGNDRLEAITFRNRNTKKIITCPTTAMFIFIGAEPHTEMLKDVVRLSDAGFILTGSDLRTDGIFKGWSLKRDPYLLETSISGIFAAGDAVHGVIRRVASAVGQGSAAVSFVHQYLKTV